MEKNTNNPIAGATVYMQKCTEPDLVVECLTYSTFSTLTTDSSGQVTVFSPPGVDRTIVEHQKYWTAESSGFGDFTLTPKCTLKASIKRVKAHLPSDVLNITIADPNCCWLRDYRIGLPIDTVVFLDAQGYTDNHVFWYINFLSTDTLHYLPPFYLIAFDTAKVDFEY
ncbi:MAG: hypothetical protein AABY93_09180 [Bacteroidota bacterium]